MINLEILNKDYDELVNDIRYEFGSFKPEYFKCQKDGGLELQQVPEEYANLLLFFRQQKIDKYLELGVAKGGSFLINCLFINANKYVAVDNSSYFGDEQRNSINEKIVYLKLLEKHIEFHDTTTNNFFDYNTDVFDLIFIDADHSYEGVKNDYLNSLKILDKSKSKNYIVFHDINSKYCEGVVRLWNEIKNENSIEFVNSETCGIGIMVIDNDEYI